MLSAALQLPLEPHEPDWLCEMGVKMPGQAPAYLHDGDGDVGAHQGFWNWRSPSQNMKEIFVEMNRTGCCDDCAWMRVNRGWHCGNASRRIRAWIAGQTPGKTSRSRNAFSFFLLSPSLDAQPDQGQLGAPCWETHRVLP